MNFLNRCAVRANAGGTDDFVLENAIPGFYTPPLCLNPTVVDGAEYNYFAVSDDGTQHEEGSGVWEVASSQLFRTTIRNSSNAGAKVTFSAAPIVYMGGPTAEDMVGGSVFRHEDGSEALVIETSSDSVELPAKIKVDNGNQITLESTILTQQQSEDGFRLSLYINNITGDRELRYPDADGVIVVVPFGGVSVADLPADPSDTSVINSIVYDASLDLASGIGTAVVGGGSNYVPVYYDFNTSEWKIG
jgi:hypothetical protein